MGMTKLKTDIEKLAKQELERGIKYYGPHTSVHQAYAVLKEELEEAEFEKRSVDIFMEYVWNSVKADTLDRMPEELGVIECHLSNQIAESIQALAMVYKFKDYLEELDGSKE